MKDCLVLGDVLTADADVLILTVDGAKRGMEGNVARAFARRWPEAWGQVEDSIAYPLRLGDAAAVKLDDAECPFRWILVAATLHHLETLDDGEKCAVVRQAFRRCLELAAYYRAVRVATTVMAGGWRLTPEAAFRAMAVAWAGFTSQERLRLTVYIMDAALYQQWSTQDRLDTTTRHDRD